MGVHYHFLRVNMRIRCRNTYKASRTVPDSKWVLDKSSFLSFYFSKCSTLHKATMQQLLVGCNFPTWIRFCVLSTLIFILTSVLSFLTVRVSANHCCLYIGHASMTHGANPHQNFNVLQVLYRCLLSLLVVTQFLCILEF